MILVGFFFFFFLLPVLDVTSGYRIRANVDRQEKGVRRTAEEERVL